LRACAPGEARSKKGALSTCSRYADQPARL
jgi:hypothetical protein